MDIADICSRLEELTEVVKGIEVGLGRLSYGDAMFPLAERPPTPSANPRARYVPTDWPRIGGRIDLPDVAAPRVELVLGAWPPKGLAA